MRISKLISVTGLVLTIGSGSALAEGLDNLEATQPLLLSDKAMETIVAGAHPLDFVVTNANFSDETFPNVEAVNNVDNGAWQSGQEGVSEAKLNGQGFGVVDCCDP